MANRASFVTTSGLHIDADLVLTQAGRGKLTASTIRPGASSAYALTGADFEDGEDFKSLPSRCAVGLAQETARPTTHRCVRAGWQTGGIAA